MQQNTILISAKTIHCFSISNDDDEYFVDISIDQTLKAHLVEIDAKIVEKLIKKCDQLENGEIVKFLMRNHQVKMTLIKETINNERLMCQRDRTLLVYFVKENGKKFW